MLNGQCVCGAASPCYDLAKEGGKTRFVKYSIFMWYRFTMPGMWRMRVGEHDLLSVDETERDLSIANVFIVSISTPTHSLSLTDSPH